MSATLDILVVGDLHYVREASGASLLPERQGRLAAVLVRKAWQRLRHLGVEPGVIVLLGDLVDDGNAQGLDRDLEELAREVKALGAPVLAVHGNHDGAPDAFEARLGTEPGLHIIGGVGLLVFGDLVGERDVTTRRGADLALPAAIAAERPDLPLIALQHNPLHPFIEARYPYMLANGNEVLDAYSRAGVVASLSGHYHRGQSPGFRDGVTYYTAPALCEAPFRFAHMRVEGRQVTIQEHALRLDVDGLSDVHCHTEYAYCGKTVSAARCLDVSRAMGVGQTCLTEHTFQLYFDRDEAWSFRWQSDPGRVAEAWRQRTGRMDEYRRFAATFRAQDVRLGLEVDLLDDGRLLLDPNDLAGWDLIVGAVHEIPGFRKGITPQAEAERLFLRDTERLAAHRITVLAHPFRFFRRARLETPCHLYGEVAAILARYGVAAEINFHTNAPDPAFYRECVRRGVRIALGSDSHDIAETGELAPHLEILREAGVDRADFGRVLLRLP